MRATRWTLPRTTLNFEQGARVMGIVNVTPDSFSDGGRFFDPERALAHCDQLIADGADILDIGGESTRPGAAYVNIDEEIRRTVPVIEAVRAQYDVPISIDTTKAPVAEAALQAGANIINDISGMRFDPNMPRVAASYDAGVILMHVPGERETMHASYTYPQIADDVWAYLKTQLRTALDAGIAPERIVIDPGFGFGKDVAQNLALLHALPFFVEKDYPVLVGLSRKRTLRAFVGPDTESLDHGSTVVHAFAIAHGAQLLRTHNVRAAKAAIAMQSALTAANAPA